MRAHNLLLAAAGALGGTGSASAQPNPDFRLTNGLSQPIAELYVSSSGQAAWGSDLLGSGVLTPGGAVSVSVPAGQCENDIKLVLANGASIERRQPNTCTLTDVTVTP